MPYDPNEAVLIIDEKDVTRVPTWASPGARKSWDAATDASKMIFAQAFKRTPDLGNREDGLMLLECFVRDLENQGESEVETAQGQSDRDGGNAVLRLAAHARSLLNGWHANADEADNFAYRLADAIAGSWVRC